MMQVLAPMRHGRVGLDLRTPRSMEHRAPSARALKPLAVVGIDWGRFVRLGGWANGKRDSRLARKAFWMGATRSWGPRERRKKKGKNQVARMKKKDLAPTKTAGRRASRCVAADARVKSLHV